MYSFAKPKSVLEIQINMFIYTAPNKINKPPPKDRKIFTDYVDDFVLFIVTPADEEVFGFDITVDKIVPVHHFYSINLSPYKRALASFIVTTYLNGFTNCKAIIRTFFRENLRPQRSNRSSRLGPISSMTSALYLPHGPK